MDNLTQHLNVEIIKSSFEKEILCYFLPPKTTHFLQPLDNLVFAAFKKYLYQITDDIRFKETFSNRQNTVTTSSILNIVYDAEFKILSGKRLIKKSFQVTGIYPFDPDKIRRNALESISGINTPNDTSQDCVKNMIETATTACTKLLVSKSSVALTPSRGASVKSNYVYNFSGLLERQRDIEKANLEKQIQVQQKKKESENRKRIAKEKRQQSNTNNRATSVNKRRRKENSNSKTDRGDSNSSKSNVCQENIHNIYKKCEFCVRTIETWEGWTGCEYCTNFWFCFVCINTRLSEYTKAMDSHENNCKKQQN